MILPKPQLNKIASKTALFKHIICNHRIEYATTATVVNDRFTTKCTLDIQLEKQDSVINSPKHRNIFDAIRQMDDTAAIITQDNIRVTNTNKISTDKESNTLLPNQRLCKVTKRMYTSFILEFEYNLSQLKYVQN